MDRAGRTGRRHRTDVGVTMTQPDQPAPGHVQLNVGAQAVDLPGASMVAFVFGVGPSQFVVHLDPETADLLAENLPRQLAAAAAEVRRKRLGLVIASNGHIPDLSQLLGGN